LYALVVQRWAGDAAAQLLREMDELGIYLRYTPSITRAKPGAVRIVGGENDEEAIVFVAAGILEIQPNTVTVLADKAIRGHDLDKAKATEAKKLAEGAMNFSSPGSCRP
jgi:F-type H+-transporting ATPase subunit epsilon